ncbi:enoyl-CoA hydratase-related protein [Corticibacterium sp. UT-5YL-CI-8]|nr:enoyl-CoA hydratase-related protein [Tianweitania sp. UT-5YL-CI-8]
MDIQAGMENEPLNLRIDAGVATLTIDKPARRNALTYAMWLELAALFQVLEADPTVRAVVLRGAGSDFSAGADISEFDTLRGAPDSARIYEAANSAAFTAVRQARIPVIAAIRGICLGGGFGLAAGADLRIATPDATFSVPAAKLGLAYPLDAMVDIVGSLGEQMAKYLTFTAARLDAASAKAAGFLLEVVETEHFDARVDEIARTIAANAPLSIKASKASMRATATGDKRDIAFAQQIGDATFASADYAEGRAAFKERRQPVFSGR